MTFKSNDVHNNYNQHDNSKCFRYELLQQLNRLRVNDFISNNVYPESNRDTFP